MTQSMLNSPTLQRYQEPGGHFLLLSVPSLRIQGWERKWGSKISQLRFWPRINHSGHPQAPDRMKPTPFFKNKGGLPAFLPSRRSPPTHCRKRGGLHSLFLPSRQSPLSLQKKRGFHPPLPVHFSAAKKGGSFPLASPLSHGKKKRGESGGVIRNPRTARLPVGIREELVTPQLELRRHRRLSRAAFTESSRKEQIGSNLSSGSLDQDRL